MTRLTDIAKGEIESIGKPIRKVYAAPRVLHELDLEVQAGSTVGDELPPGISTEN